MTAIIDYGVGNLFSLCSSLRALGEEPLVTAEADALLSADRLILPGVGAFGDAMEQLASSGLAPVVREAAGRGTPLMGVCLGMQLLFDLGLEFGEREGLGLIPGSVVPLAPATGGLKTPHMGWNALDIKKPDCPILKYSNPGDFCYFVHSFYASCGGEHVAASAEYGIPVPAVVRRDNIFGCQFHPEKSGRAGLSILRAFLETGGAA